MLTVVSESVGSSRALIDAERSLSLASSRFGSHKALARKLNGSHRRLVVLGKQDLNAPLINVLLESAKQSPLGIVVCAKRKQADCEDDAEALNRLYTYKNLEWASDAPDSDTLKATLSRCRRRLLKISRQELEQGLEKAEMFLQYQPKVERSGDEWTAHEVEALIRWRHPEHGPLGPLEFLPEAEAFNFMGEISEFVLREVGKQLLKWEARELPLNACINLASSQLDDKNLADHYQQIVKDMGLSCDRFSFEVNEQEIADSEAPHLKVLTNLRDYGFRISLDDFASVVSSIGVFEKLPIDEIKLHAAAIKRAQNDETAQKVLAAVTGLAHNLGITVCAEGVEEMEVYEFLNTIQCDKMQGYLISEAVMPDIIRKVYRPIAKAD